MKKPIIISLLIIVLFTVNILCQPNLEDGGTITIFNESSETLTIKYLPDFSGKCDTLLLDLPSKKDTVIRHLEKMMDNQNINCCPCLLHIFYIKSPHGEIKKVVSADSNWKFTRDEVPFSFFRQERYYRPKIPVRCEFHITDTDL